jgi:flagellar biosynthetic protein FlhB
VIFLIAVADYAYQHWEYIKKMRMTKQEVKDENKQQEGDPHVKGRIRSLRIQRSRERMMQAVPTANVVVTNPTHYAVALKYDMGVMAAPVVVAKGVDHLALRIRAIAEENGVAIVENPPLARTLYAAVDVDQEIRPDHYKAVAEVIGFVMRLKGKGRP